MAATAQAGGVRWALVSLSDCRCDTKTSIGAGQSMKRFDLNRDFSADCTIADKSRAGEIYHVRRSAFGSGMNLTPVAWYFAWQPLIIGFNGRWRVDCFVKRHPLAPREPISLGQALVAALMRENLCEEPLWLSAHRTEDEKGQAYGNVFEDD